jgi:hypothetical protein
MPRQDFPWLHQASAHLRWYHCGGCIGGRLSQSQSQAQFQAKWLANFDCACRELHAFIVASVEDTGIRKFRDPVTGYSQMLPKDMLTHLLASFRGCIPLEFSPFALACSKMHVDAIGIPEYIITLRTPRNIPHAERGARSMPLQTWPHASGNYHDVVYPAISPHYG